MSDAKVEFETLGYDPADAGKEERFSFRCPKRGTQCAGLLIRGAGGGRRPSWIWDGNRDAPTFSPSINCEKCWHGFIENGRCVDVNKRDEPEPPIKETTT